MANKMRVVAKLAGDVTTVKALIKHPMDTGQVKDKKTGELIPAHFIQELTCTHNGNVVMTALWGAAVSKDPYLSFRFKGAKAGDKFTLSWVDNKGEKDSSEAVIG